MPESPPLNLPEILASHDRWLNNEDSGQRARLDGANLSGARLDGANLSGARLDGANLSGARLDGARLDGARLFEANLSGARLDGANLSGARLDGARLDGANLSGANFSEANLSEANLRGASLVGANLSGARLDGARLIGANLSGANLRGARLRGARLDRAFGIPIAADALKRLQAAAAAALQEGALEMNNWHTCDTTHCLSGWLIRQAGEAGRLLENTVGPEVAGLMLGGVEAHSHFFDSNKAATKWLQSVLAQSEVTK